MVSFQPRDDLSLILQIAYFFHHRVRHHLILLIDYKKLFSICQMMVLHENFTQQGILLIDMARKNLFLFTVFTTMELQYCLLEGGFTDRNDGNGYN